MLEGSPQTPEMELGVRIKNESCNWGEHVCGELLCICVVPPSQAKRKGGKTAYLRYSYMCLHNGCPSRAGFCCVILPVSLQQTPCPTAPPLLSG